MNPPLPAVHGGRLRAGLLVMISLWFLLALAGSLAGTFDTPHRPPLLLGAAAFLPALAFTAVYVRSAALRRLLRTVNLRLLVLAQTWRVGGVVFLILQQRGVLPAVFALPAGWGDFAIGATAPLVAWALASPRRLSRRVFVLWNVLGILDLVLAVTLGVLASASPLGVLATGITTAAMGAWPLSMIPTFFVPLFIILHVIALGRGKY
jgi:hypothetical protein